MQAKTGDIAFNITKHLEFIDAAIKLKMDFIAFPELSITGYEPTLAESLAMYEDDQRLSSFASKSEEFNLLIGVGLPLRKDGKLYITQMYFIPEGDYKAYAKQILHSDEYPFFDSGQEQILLTHQDDLVAPAICYESLQFSHVNEAVARGATIYVASVAKEKKVCMWRLNIMPI
ncbi:carbon-nitrogen hydrolase family protein [Alteromonas facilis]|uniref:carbon-nitrogen hydrolase family protein n=1 Tax=Alteromonas facilis TaxID=2048004 RepID=UPI001F0B8DC5|nr:carbon-nitrogen hydrolase family protein [Alteromonas facilis]